MAEQPDSQWQDPGRAERLARRESRRRGLRRRRLGALAALVAFALAASLVLVYAGGTLHSSTSRRHLAVGARRGGGGEPRRSSAVRNATPQPGWRPHAGPVPILEYHVLGPAPADAPYPELYVTRPDFHRQMNWLDENGYEAVTLETVERAWYHGGGLPTRPVVISFDDGYRPQFTYALPELRGHGWPGVLDLKAEGSDLYASNVEAMIDAGWELASHTIDHSDLTRLESAQLAEEVAGSRKLLQREYGVPVKDFCYPAGRFDETVIAAVKAAGYAGATTEIPGYATRDAAYELARFEVLGSTGVAGLAEDLER